MFVEKSTAGFENTSSPAEHGFVSFTADATVWSGLGDT